MGWWSSLFRRAAARRRADAAAAADDEYAYDFDAWTNADWNAYLRQYDDAGAWTLRDDADDDAAKNNRKNANRKNAVRS